MNIHAFAQHGKNSTQLLAREPRVFSNAPGRFGDSFGVAAAQTDDMLVVPGILRQHHIFSASELFAEIAGSAGGALKTGQAMGMSDVKAFGNPKYCTGLLV